MVSLKHHIWDIYAIGRENDTEVSVSRDMFIANLRHKREKYKGAQADYETLGDSWSQMTESQRHHEAAAVIAITRAHHKALSRAWQRKDRAAFDDVIRSLGEG